MLIVLTQDQNVIDWCNSPESGASNWGTLNIINTGSAPPASVKLKSFLKQVQPQDNLCITGHGNDDEIGDENLSGMMSWSWTSKELAGYLASYLPSDYTGSILLEVCADTKTTFATTVAIELEKLGKLRGIWIYAYNKKIDVKHQFPDPNKMNKNVELVAIQVGVSRV